MPIRPELRHLYAPPAWPAIRARIFARAGNCCEQCGAGGGSFVMRLVQISGDEYRIRRVQIQLGVAHLDHNPENNAETNLKALCRRCHLAYDAPKHKDTRAARKDAARPLLGVAHG